MLFLACPLLSGGVAPSNISADENGAMRAQVYSVYILNPSPFPFATTRIDVWRRDCATCKTASPISEEIERTTIPAHTGAGNAVVVHFQDLALDLNDTVGSSVECDVR